MGFWTKKICRGHIVSIKRAPVGPAGGWRATGGRGSSTAWGLQQLVMENHSAIRGLKISHRGAACALLVDYATRCSGARSRLEADRLTSRMRCCRKVRRGVVAGCVFRVRGSRRCGFSESHLPCGGCAGCGCGELRNRPLGLSKVSGARTQARTTTYRSR